MNKAEFKILKSSSFAYWERSLKCCVAISKVVRLTMVNATAIHNRIENGERKVWLFRLYTFGFLMKI